MPALPLPPFRLVLTCGKLLAWRRAMEQTIRAAVLVLATFGQAWAGELFDATSKGDAAAVDRLLSSGAAVDEPGRNGETPLIIAALNDRQDIAALLLAHGADVQARNAGGFTPLH